MDDEHGRDVVVVAQCRQRRDIVLDRNIAIKDDGVFRCIAANERAQGLDRMVLEAGQEVLSFDRRRRKERSAFSLCHNGKLSGTRAPRAGERRRSIKSLSRIVDRQDADAAKNRLEHLIATDGGIADVEARDVLRPQDQDRLDTSSRSGRRYECTSVLRRSQA